MRFLISSLIISVAALISLSIPGRVLGGYATDKCWYGAPVEVNTQETCTALEQIAPNPHTDNVAIACKGKDVINIYDNAINGVIRSLPCLKPYGVTILNDYVAAGCSGEDRVKIWREEKELIASIECKEAHYAWIVKTDPIELYAACQAAPTDHILHYRDGVASYITGCYHPMAAVELDGKLYAICKGDSSLRSWNADGSNPREIAKGLGSLEDIAVDPHKKVLYFTNDGSQHIFAYDIVQDRFLPYLKTDCPEVHDIVVDVETGNVAAACAGDDRIWVFHDGVPGGTPTQGRCIGARGVGVNIANQRLYGTCPGCKSVLYWDCHSGVEGDPVFSGFHGQRFQVHGTPDSVYSLITSADVQLNARFAFFGNGRSSLRTLALTQYSADSLSKPVTRPFTTMHWTHPGSYMSELGVKFFNPTTGEEMRIRIEAGSWEHGLNDVSINGVPLAPGQSTFLTLTLNNYTSCRWGVIRLSSHTVSIITPHFRIGVANSDEFVNLDSVELIPKVECPDKGTEIWDIDRKADKVHGLLGHTAVMGDERKAVHRQKHPMRELSINATRSDNESSDNNDEWKIPGRVDDYEEGNNDIFGDRFVFNKYAH